MTLSDDQLLNFDKDRLAYANRTDFQRLLAEEPLIYRNHLAIALWLDGFAEGAEEHERDRDFTKALREVAANLRQGDLLPNGILLHGLNEAIARQQGS